MARNGSWTWTVIISFLVGVLGASIFWFYSPYGHDQLAQQVAKDLRTQRLPVQVKEGPVNPKQLVSQARGSRFQMVADGKDAFLVDLKDGRVWRYFHQTKEGGASKDEEGFLPLPFYYAGKKHFAASEIEATPSPSGGSSQPQAVEKQSQ
jgi:hypothetical protein